MKEEIKVEKKTLTKKNSNQQIYKVRIYKDFEFPSFSIDRHNKLEDLSYKALNEVRENSIDITENYFNVEIINVIPFNINIPKEITTNNTDYDFVIRELALLEMKKKYNFESYEKNPELFEIDKNKTSTDFQVNLKLKPEIESFFIEKVQSYTNALRYKTVYH